MVGENQHCCLPIGPSRLGRGMVGWRGGVTWSNPAESLIIGLPSCSGGQREREKEREVWTRTKKPLYHTQAAHCCLFTRLHLRPLYHSIRTTFTPHSREKSPSIKLKTSHWHWRAHRKRATVRSLHFHYSLPLFLSLFSTTPTLLPPLLFQILWRRKGWREGEEERKKGHLLTLGLVLSFLILFLCSVPSIFSPPFPSWGSGVSIYLPFSWFHTTATGVSCG